MLMNKTTACVQRLWFGIFRFQWFLDRPLGALGFRRVCGARRGRSYWVSGDVRAMVGRRPRQA
eukprot:4490381-Lingulodinium_polyedra.AAC.1